MLFFVLAPMASHATNLSCPNAAGFLPKPQVKAGTPNPDIPLRHIIVIMQENHSFDTYFGRLNQARYYGSRVDGVSEQMSNPDTNGKSVNVYHQPKLCVEDPDHQESSMRESWDNGKNDGFAKSGGLGAMGYFDQRDLPFYYTLANSFAIADRYFCSMLGPTFPNRFFLLTGTAFGHSDNTYPDGPTQFAQKTIFDVLDQYGISWRYYTDYSGNFSGEPGYVSLFHPLLARDRAKIGTVADYAKDMSSEHFPTVAFIDANEWLGEDEHPSADIQIGQAWVAARIQTLLKSPLWKDSVLFLTYDENGGFYDHVAPPPACAPDDIHPEDYSVYGFRVPFLAISPYVKHHYVSHAIYDHTSILKFIETKFNLPSLTRRDANANSLLDLFDFKHPQFEVPKLIMPTVKSPCQSRPRNMGSSNSG